MSALTSATSTVAGPDELEPLREGFGRAADELPARLTRPLESGGPADGNAITEDDFEAVLDEYSGHRGWTHDGVPTAGTVERLAIEDVVPSGLATGA